MLIKLRSDTASQTPVNKNVELTGYEICLSHFKSLTITMVNFYIVLLEAQLLYFPTVNACCDAEEFWYTEIDKVASWCADPLEVVMVMDFDNLLDSNLYTATGKMDKTAPILHNSMFCEQSTSRCLTGVQINLLKRLKVASEQ
jgi:hypothetical protein